MNDFNSPEDLFREEVKKIKDKGKDYWKYLVPIAGIILVIILTQGCIYSIGPDEVGVIQRLGKYARSTEPGLHIKIPFGIEKMTPVKVKKIFKEEFGFKTTSPGVKTIYASSESSETSLMLTGDLNILDVKWIVQFKIDDPVKLIFKTRNISANVRDMSEVVTRRLCGDYTVDEVLTTKRQEIAIKAQEELQKLLDKYEVGISIVTVKLLDVNPPDEVKPAFNKVNEAKQERERMINEAWEAYNKEIPRAQGEALRTVSQAEGYGLERVNSAQGEAERFTDTYDEYKKAPDVTKKRMHLETMKKILPDAGRKFVIDPDQSSILPLMKLDSEKGGAE